MAFRFDLFFVIRVPPEEYRDENVTLMMIMTICDGFDGDVHRLYEDSWQRELAVSTPCTGKLGTEDPIPLLWRERCSRHSLLRSQFPVLLRRKQLFILRLFLYLDDRYPSLSIGILINQFRPVLQFLIDPYHDAAHGGIEL